MTKFLCGFGSELINYGGMAATRLEAYNHAFGVCVNNASMGGLSDHAAKLAAVKAAGMFAMGPRAKQLPPGEVACLVRFNLTS